MRVRRALFPVLGMLALVATACPEQPGGGGTTTTTTSTTTSTTTTTLADNDGDGYNTATDCNDNNASINPGQTVDTVGDDVDSNCDGVDGVATNSIFVSSGTGSNHSLCGIASNDPCATIAQGLSRAASTSRTQVQVAQGTYAKFTVVAGYEIGGHYNSATWKKAGAGDSVITASFDAAAGGPVGILATGITTATKVSDFVVNGVAAPQGQRSYGVVVKNSTSALVFDTVTVNGGTGGTGSAGGPGSGGWGGAAASGSGGGGGFEPGGACNTSAAGAGGAGAGGGGTGGKGGAIDTNCGVFSLDLDAQPGATGGAGSPGGAAGGAGGVGADEGFPWVCTISGGNPVHGSPGNPGVPGANGAGGAAGAAAGNGGTGNLGSNGNPGGGGGGGGANDCNVDDAGAGGGGGGAGGARATAGGGGGGAGQASIAFWSDNSSVTLTGVELRLGTGGTGGTGGAGAAGQPGGAGGPGGAAYDRGGAGGAGGQGGVGGSSGGGGGGGGGNAIGLGRSGAAVPTGTPSYALGTGGAGGAGGSGAATGNSGIAINNTTV